MKHLFFFPYSLKLKNSGQLRQGALLKASFKDGAEGHADLHPHLEKKEEDLGFYLNTLKQKKFTLPLCQRALAITQIEAQALVKGQSLLSRFDIPKSHFLITDLDNFKGLETALNQGFKVFKVKLKSPLNQQSQKLLELIKAGGENVKWRLDFHDFLNEREWREWIKESLTRLPKENIDFIEAPFVYKERLGLWDPNPLDPNQFGLAWDVWSGENTLPVYALVFKTSRKNPRELLTKQHLFKRVIFTHTLAHPLDQIASAYLASQFYHVRPCLKEVCGLVQTGIYEESDWTLPYQGPLFPKLSGPGWGLSHLLDRLPWKKLF